MDRVKRDVYEIIVKYVLDQYGFKRAITPEGKVIVTPIRKNAVAPGHWYNPEEPRSFNHPRHPHRIIYSISSAWAGKAMLASILGGVISFILLPSA